METHKIQIIETVIEEYTSESGVRGLDKKIAKLVRNRARQIAMEEEIQPKVTKEENQIFNKKKKHEKKRKNTITARSRHDHGTITHRTRANPPGLKNVISTVFS